MLQSYDGAEPAVHESAFVHERATVIGDVTIEAGASVWPGVVLRGDKCPIVIREETNVQDNAVCHERVEIGPRATIGHAAIVHDCTVREEALVGMNAVVLDGTTVGERGVVAAGSVVTEGTDVAPGTLVAGVPAEIVRESIDESEPAAIPDRYLAYSRRHMATAETLDSGRQPDGRSSE